MDRMEWTMQEVMEVLKMLKNDVIKSEDQEYTHNGVNIMRLHTQRAYAYDLHLMGILLQRTSYVFVIQI